MSRSCSKIKVLVSEVAPRSQVGSRIKIEM